MDELEEALVEGVENALQALQDNNDARLVSSAEPLAQMDDGNTAFAEAIMIGGEHSESALFCMSKRSSNMMLVS